MKKLLLFFGLLLAANSNSNAQSTTFLDPLFGVNGRFSVVMPGTNALSQIKTDANDNIYVGGTRTVSSVNSFLLFKSTSNGSLDNTFGNQGVVLTNFSAGSNDILKSIALLSSGKILAGGYTGTAGANSTAIAKYNADGTLDSTFGINGTLVKSIGYHSKISSVAIQSDGKILAGGLSRSTVSSNTNILLIRFDGNGVIDSTFGSNGIDSFRFNTGSDSLVSMSLQQDGKVVVCGSGGVFVYSPGFVTDGGMFLVRLYPNGSIDSTFGINGYMRYNNGTGTSYLPTSFLILQNGKMVASDYRTGTHANSTMKQFSNNGILDSTFKSGATYTSSYGVEIILNPPVPSSAANGYYVDDLISTSDGGIIAAGANQTISGNVPALTKIKSNGHVDSTFGFLGAMSDANNFQSTIKSLALQSNDKIIAGDNKNNGIEILRFQNTGTTIPLGINLLNFNVSSQRNDAILNWSILSDAALESFSIQRGVDGANFADINNVLKTNNAKYSYVDQNLENGRYYYRIRLKETNGQYSYSKIEQVEINNTESIAVIFPNPVMNRGNFNLKLSMNASGIYRLIIRDMNGKQVLSLSKNVVKGEQIIPINVSHLSIGNYTLEVINSNNNKISGKLFSIK